MREERDNGGKDVTCYQPPADQANETPPPFPGSNLRWYNCQPQHTCVQCKFFSIYT